LPLPITISSIHSVSALGSSPAAIWQSYLARHALFNKVKAGNEEEIWCSQLAADLEPELNALQQRTAYRNLDRTVLLAILASKKAFSQREVQKNMGVNIGSSRGATQLFEKYHKEFLATNRVSAYSSPTTTLGNVSSWVAQELGVNGVSIDHSVTCSTGLHAVLNAIAWLKSGMATSFLVGGSEAAITPFTIAQMKSLKLYSTSENLLACESMRFEKKKNTMVLGEGAAVALLEQGISERTQAIISGYGFASEVLAHNSAISESADCFQKSMKMALQQANLETVDAIVMHAPGTVKGDLAEKQAIEIVFEKLPLLTSNKWLVGHTFAASGMLNMEMAVLMLQNNKFIENPFFANARDLPKELKTIMVNAVGFGGNAVSIILQKAH
jgi:3-oxoacyl-[acyl-carrier-protein] synthase II